MKIRALGLLAATQGAAVVALGRPLGAADAAQLAQIRAAWDRGGPMLRACWARSS
jgi:hypothetical protein